MPLYNPSIIARARELLAGQPVFLDTETTGLGERAEIVEICVIDTNASVLLQSLVRPVRPLTPEMSRIHGISGDQLKSAPSWMILWPKVDAVLHGRAVGIYNAEFDLRLMQQSHQAIGLPWRPPVMQPFCIMNLYSDLVGALKRFSLEDAARQAGIGLPNLHRAYEDTLLARELFLWICRQANQVT